MRGKGGRGGGGGEREGGREKEGKRKKQNKTVCERAKREIERKAVCANSAPCPVLRTPLGPTTSSGTMRSCVSDAEGNGTCSVATARGGFDQSDRSSGYAQEESTCRREG